MAINSIMSECSPGVRFGVRFKLYCVRCDMYNQFGRCPHERTAEASVECREFKEWANGRLFR